MMETYKDGKVNRKMKQMTNETLPSMMKIHRQPL